MIVTPIVRTGEVIALARAYKAPGAPLDIATVGIVTELRESRASDGHEAHHPGAWVEVVRLGYYASLGPFVAFVQLDTTITVPAPVHTLMLVEPRAATCEHNPRPHVCENSKGYEQ